MKKDLNVRVFQLCSNDSFEENSEKILNLLKTYAQHGEFCLFPENSLYINIDKSVKVPPLSLKHPFYEKLKSLCVSKKLDVHLGSVPQYGEGDESGKLFNQSLVMDSKGVLTKPYKKIHLFRAHVGETRIDEADLYASGCEPRIIEVQGWKVGLSICYDIRFSDLYSIYAKQGCDLILAPSAFINETGKAHWEVLLRARAIESQAYVVASAQAGTHKSIHGGIRKSYGHSLAVTPWGNVLFDLEKQVDCSKNVTLKFSEIKKMRDSLVMNRNLIKN